MDELPSQSAEPEMACESTPSVRKSSRQPVTKKLDDENEPCVKFCHKWTVADKTILLQALKEFGDTDIYNISLKLPNKHPNQIKVFITNLKCKAKIFTEYRIQRRLGIKMAKIKRVIKYIEKFDKKSMGTKPFCYNPALLIALTVIKNLEEHPPIRERGMDYKLAYEYLADIINYQGNNTNVGKYTRSNKTNKGSLKKYISNLNKDNIKNIINTWNANKARNENKGTENTGQACEKAKDTESINKDPENTGQACEKARDTESINKDTENTAQACEKAKDTENIYKNTENTGLAIEKTKDTVSINKDTENTGQACEKAKDTESINKDPENTGQACEKAKDTENIYKNTENTGLASEKTKDTVSINIDTENRNKDAENNGQDSDKTNIENKAEHLSYQTKFLVLQSIYMVLKSAVFNSYELNAVITSEPDNQPLMFEFNEDPQLLARKEELENRLKSYLDNGVHNPLGFSRETLPAIPTLFDHFLKCLKDEEE